MATTFKEPRLRPTEPRDWTVSVAVPTSIINEYELHAYLDRLPVLY